jgi:hypothetical protein
MKEKRISNERYMVKDLCNQVRKLIDNREYESCYEIITEEMKKSPHAPEPHNLLGMLLEKEGDHILAMKHFRAAWALDPTYLPARHNLEVFGTFFSNGAGAYDEDDCPILEEKNTYTVEYDEKKVGHVIRRNKNEN